MKTIQIFQNGIKACCTCHHGWSDPSTKRIFRIRGQMSVEQAACECVDVLDHKGMIVLSLCPTCVASSPCMIASVRHTRKMKDPIRLVFDNSTLQNRSITSNCQQKLPTQGILISKIRSTRGCI